MASSFVEFRGKGFWSRDEVLGHALAQLVTAARLRSEPWLVAAIEEWEEQSCLVGSGCLAPELDRFVVDDGRVAIVLSLVSDAQSAASATELVATLSLFQKLLHGQLATDASSPLDYLVSVPVPYAWRVDDATLARVASRRRLRR
ncbi:MAG: hypothetical protein JNK15_20185 [Planctomycetes bacterium]|nr:hypothetical protein [Planctomycetota bacterium]